MQKRSNVALLGLIPGRGDGRPTTTRLLHKMDTQVRCYGVSIGTAWSLPCRDENRDLPSSAYLDRVSNEGGGVYILPCTNGSVGSQTELCHGVRAVAVNQDLVLHKLRSVLRDLKADFACDVVVAALGHLKLLLGLVEEHPTVHKGVVFPLAEPRGLVALAQRVCVCVCERNSTVSW